MGVLAGRRRGSPTTLAGIMNFDQTEKAYLKQPTIFEYGKHRRGVGKAVQSKDKRTTRYVKNIGLGFRTPEVAANGKYIDRKCPWTGNVSIRGRVVRGRIISTKMKGTIIVRRDSLNYVPKYKRYEKRHRNSAVHISPAFLAKEGDYATIGECRPLSKTVKFNVLEVEAKTGGAVKQRKL